MATEKATVPMETLPQHSSVECQMEEHRRALHREARSVRETAEEKQERLNRKKQWVVEKRTLDRLIPTGLAMKANWTPLLLK